MQAKWSEADRDTAYTRLCEAVTQVGQDNEAAFLARLTLILTEVLGNYDVFMQALEGAKSAETDGAP